MSTTASPRHRRRGAGGDPAEGLRGDPGAVRPRGAHPAGPPPGGVDQQAAALDEHDQLAVAEEPGEREARPTVWRSALAGRTLRWGGAHPHQRMRAELELAVAH